MSFPLAYLEQVELPLAAQGQHAPIRALFLYRGTVPEGQTPSGYYVASLRSEESAARLTEQLGYPIQPLHWTYRRHLHDLDREAPEVPDCVQTLLHRYGDTLLTTRSHFLTCWVEDLTHVHTP
jgi:hypothetical protein